MLTSPTLGQEEVIFLDFCPKREQLERVYNKAKSTIVYDHHKTAQEDCGDLPYVIIDQNKSGIGIAWDTFCKTKRPFLVDCVEDGDLWRWKVPDSDKVLIVLELMKFDFDIWSNFASALEIPHERAKIIEKGAHYVEYRSVVTRQLMSGRKVHKLVNVGPNKITLPAVNASIYQSGIGNILAKKVGPAAIVYYTNGSRTFFSLRSTDSGLDVSKIASHYGGGGHRNAAAFVLDSTDPLPNAGETMYPDDYSEAQAELLTFLLDMELLQEDTEGSITSFAITY
jgi:oligoribonuclease NrnB/cAMP/cGMP phosphodiesterase (DHH superfamily)